jgi:hypothetical protein
VFGKVRPSALAVLRLPAWRWPMRRSCGRGLCAGLTAHYRCREPPDRCAPGTGGGLGAASNWRSVLSRTKQAEKVLMSAEVRAVV